MAANYTDPARLRCPPSARDASGTFARFRCRPLRPRPAPPRRAWSRLPTRSPSNAQFSRASECSGSVTPLPFRPSNLDAFPLRHSLAAQSQFGATAWPSRGTNAQRFAGPGGGFRGGLLLPLGRWPNPAAILSLAAVSRWEKRTKERSQSSIVTSQKDRFVKRGRFPKSL